MWRAILRSTAEEQECWRALEALARDLAEHVPTGADLASGTTGQALFLSYLSTARGDTELGERAMAALEASMEALAANALEASLYGGFAGIAWGVEHLRGELFAGDASLCEPVDEALGELLANPEAEHRFDLIYGLSGLGLYLVERLPSRAATERLGRIIDLLASTAESTPDGITWFTPPEWLTPSQRGRQPEGWYDLGVAHGVPGVLGFLAAAHRAGLEHPRLRELALGTASWLLAQRRSDGEQSVFPSVLMPSRGHQPARTAWCYGDLGVAAVLLGAAESFGRSDWRRQAEDVARLAAVRSDEAVAAVDAGLCHGAAGLGHLFNRLGQLTGEPLLLAAARRWFGQALAMRQPGEGIAGFRSWGGTSAADSGWQTEPGFLTGAAGIGLALLAAVTDIEPSWDRVMLLSLPPRPLSTPARGAP